MRKSERECIIFFSSRATVITRYCSFFLAQDSLVCFTHIYCISWELISSVIIIIIVYDIFYSPSFRVIQCGRERINNKQFLYAKKENLHRLQGNYYFSAFKIRIINIKGEVWK